MPRKKSKKRSKKKRGGEIKTYTKQEAKNKVREDYINFLKKLQDKYNIYVGSDLVTSSEKMHKNNLFRDMCDKEGIQPSDIDPNVNTFKELFNKYKFSDIIKLLFEAQYIFSNELKSALNIKGGKKKKSKNKNFRTRSKSSKRSSKKRSVKRGG